jgi:membrane protease YdiL (CAAX protease family)
MEQDPTSTRQLQRFFIFTFAASWILWIPIIILQPPMVIAMPVVLLGAFAPTLVAIILTRRYGDREERSDFWRRCFDLKRISSKWWAVILLTSPMIALVAGILDKAFGGPELFLDLQTLTNPAGLAGFIVLMILGGPLAEELGWRGYALDRLQAKRTALVASLLLGVVWVIWHFPLFLMEGTSQAALGFGTVQFWLWSIQVMALSIIFTWVYNNTARSTLSAVLLHFMDNTTFSLMTDIGESLPLQTEIIRTSLYVLVAVIVVVGWGAKTMTRARNDVPSS